MTIAKNSLKKQPLAFFPPRLGKPYVNEFTKKKPNFVSWESNETSILLKMELESGEMEGLFLTQIVQLFGDGIVHKWVEIENRGSQIHDDVAISLPHYHELGPTYFPLDEEVVYFSEKRIIEFGDLKPPNITGNWYFSKNKPESIGISWSSNSKATPEGWQFVIEDEFGALAPGDRKTSEKIVVSIGAFGLWEDFRAFANEASIVEKSDLRNEHDFESAQLIVDSSLTFSLKTHRNSYLDGQLQISMNEHLLHQDTIAAEEEKTVHFIDIKSDFEPITIIEGKYQDISMTTHFNELILSPTDESISSHTSSLAGFGIVESTNGSITIKSAPDFYPGIYSLKVNGAEWLDTSFPNLKAKSWWNPWAGGMKTAPSGMNTFSLKKEKHDAFSVEKYDSQGNKWSGLGIKTEIVEHSQWKNVQYIQYFLMLPGVPVLTTYLEVKDSAGKNLKEESWATDFFIGGEDLPNLSLQVDGHKQTIDYKTGVQQLPFSFDMECSIASITKSEKLYLVPSLYATHTEAYTNKEAFQLLAVQSALPNTNGSKTAPLFMLFDSRELSADQLQRLRRVQF